MKKSNLLVFISLILGIVGGIFIPEFMKSISFIGTIYINLLKFMIVPIIFTSVIVTIYKSKNNKGNVVFKSILLFVIMFVLTFLLTSVIVTLFKPGVGFVFPLTEWDGEVTKFSVADIIVNLFPNNIITIIQNNSIFAVLIVAFFSGVAATKVKNSKVVIDFVDGVKEISFKLLEYIMYLTPIAVFALIGNTVALYGTTIIGVGAKYILFAYICSILTLILIMIVPVWLFAKINPIVYIKKVSKVWLMTLTTCSSAATLPTTIKVCNKEFGISNKITDIVVPLGCTIHMCGGAVSFALLGLFTSQMFGVEISFVTYLVMILSATMINMAAPGIPNGGIVIGATYLSMLNIPLSFIGFYSGIYKLLDMAYTTLNVTGDITANILINKSINKKQ